MYVREITEAFQSLIVFGLKHLGRFAQILCDGDQGNLRLWLNDNILQ